MKQIKLIHDEMGEAYDPKDGSCSLDLVDYKASPHEVLATVDGFLKDFGLEVVIGDDGSDQVFFKVEKVESQKISSIVVTKNCDCCGHHEVGVENDAGKFVPLKSGMKIQIEEVKSDED